MKLSFDREKLLSAFQMAASVAPARSPKPILTSVKLESTPETSTVLATDLEVGIRVRVSGIECQAPGEAVLPIQLFGSILRESSDATLKMESAANGVVVRGERSKFNLPMVNPDEFPRIEEFAEESYHEVSARLLRELIHRTVFATDNESSRYALGGVLLEFEGERVTAIGTDGRRLAKMEGPAHAVNERPVTGQTTIVPTRAMHLIERALTDGDATVRLAARANDLLVQTPSFMLYSRLVEGRFPKWRDVFPKRETSTRLEMPVGPLHAAVRQAAIVTSTDSRGVDFRFADGKLEMSGQSADAGQALIELPIAYDGPPLVVVLDPRYLSDFLRVLDQEASCLMEFYDAQSAVVCSTPDGYGYVIMPLSRN